ncbi:MAG: molybdopterin molybdotransferase MoeA [Candidatus Zixiibacteriota bacterium]|nr:MAG: molybdopterin molybdotransferase MoeA [candidate division Zixibacteria bacterium]
MIELQKACDLVFENTPVLGTQGRLIEESVGYVLAEDVISSINVAPFRNSAMDGFAVRSEWLAGCSDSNPCILPIGQTIFAGDAGQESVSGGRAVKVMTGAPVPDEFDAVVPFEHTEYNQTEVRFFGSIASGANVRPPGEDIAAGQKLYEKGTTLGRLDTGILATIGLRSVTTFRRPSLLVLGTGDEIISPGERLAVGKIYDANTFTLQALLTPLSASLHRVPAVQDRREELEKTLRSPHDVVVTSGGVSAGERDLVVKMAESAGWKTVFHKARIKPGKPIYFATKGKQLLFGLPGNPLSTAVTCSVFVIPALKKMTGRTDYHLQPQPAVLAPGGVRKSGRTLIWPGFIREEDGRTVVEFSPKKSSAAMTAVLNSDGLIVQSPTDGGAGDVTVQAIRWRDILDA